MKENSKWKYILCCCIGRKRSICKCDMILVDAENYYNELMQKKKEELVKRLGYTLRNIGCAFILFKSSALVYEIRHSDIKNVIDKL